MKIIEYNLIEKVNVGTEEEPVRESRKGNKKVIKCTTDNLEANEEIAKAEAYNGEYIIEDDGQPETAAGPTTDEILNALLGVTP